MSGPGRSGAALGVELGQLVRAANGELPIVEAAFNRVQGKIQNAQYMISTAFLRHPDFGGGGGDKHTTMVHQFAEHLVTCVGESEHRIALIAEALRMAAQEYSRTDEGARAALQAIMKQDTVEQNGPDRAIPNIELPL